ncbi:helix-turn-helix domain-containing protein [Neobacillus sp. SM06]|uniref:helix-turn-helix domain-containing protein n=1 Tax=Neobacillus sp. SM06 TaxID=3422492 RepID=UPI003D2E25BC
MTELGNRLKEARLAKGISLDDLQLMTKIQKRYLVGIEEGDYSAMPGNFYVRAFIKQYAEAVELDADEIFETYKGEIPATNHEDLPEQLSRVKTRRTISENQSKLLNALPKVVIAVVVIGVAMLLYYILQQRAGSSSKESSNNQAEPKIVKSENLNKSASAGNTAKKNGTDATKQKDNSTTSTPVTPEAPKQEINVVQSAGFKTTYELKNADKFVVKVLSKGQSWVEIKNGKGNSVFRGMLNSGASNVQDLTGEPEAVIVVGRTLDAEVYVNDQKIDYAIPPNQEVRQDITIRFVPKGK